MKLIFQELNNPYPGFGTEIELRLYKLLTIIATVLSFFVIIPFNLLQRIPVQVDIAVAVFGTASFLLYLLAVRSRIYQAGFFLIILALLNSVWFYNAGSTGSVPYYFFMAIIYLVFFFRGWKRLILMSITLANVILLMAIELLHPDLLVPFASNNDRMADQITGVMTAAIGAYAVLWVIVSTYDREHEQCKKLNDSLTEVLDISIQKTAELEQSLAEIKTLQGLLPICACCKKIRDDYGLWTRVEEYISSHTEAEFTHGLCPDCFNLEMERFEAFKKGARNYDVGK
ncbi:MAG: hypothetical protein HXX17_03370 [Geobacteraceae bacterium]|nr:hypothetical protein [Geobacteraceae bacterium]